jgi:hypothetical protein
VPNFPTGGRKFPVDHNPCWSTLSRQDLAALAADLLDNRFLAPKPIRFGTNRCELLQPENLPDVAEKPAIREMVDSTPARTRVGLSIASNLWLAHREAVRNARASGLSF